MRIFNPVLMLASLFLLSSFLVSTSLAWWQNGHLMTSFIAYEDLKANAPELVPILDQISSFLDPVMPYPWDFVSGADFPDQVKVAHFNILNNVHFIDQPYNPFGNFISSKIPNINLNNPQGLQNLFGKLRQAYKEGDQTRLYSVESTINLFYLTHLWGDLHQPLHCTTFVSDAFPNGDYGGNSIKITGVAACSECTNLHSLWDDMGGIFPQLNFPMSAADRQELSEFSMNLTTKYPKDFFGDEVQQIDPFEIASEGIHYSADYVYPKPIELGMSQLFKTAIVLPDDYVEMVGNITGQRVALGGYRLSEFIQKLFEESD